MALIHFLFVVFVVVGGFIALRWRWVVWVHLPCAVWGTLIELGGWICPLTPLENRLRLAGGATGYSGGFIERYVLPVLYPVGLTRGLQLVLGGLVIGVNLVVYGWLIHRHRLEHQSRG